MCETMSYKRWNNEDLHYLEKSWGLRPVSVIARRLKRTNHAVRLKAASLKLGRRTEYVDGVSLGLFLKVLLARGCNANKHDYKKYFSVGAPYFSINDKRKFYLVNIDKFWEWAEQNPNVYDLSRIEFLSLGKEPSWMHEYRKRKSVELADKRWGKC